MVNWVHAGPSLAAAFLASLVEFIEALTVVLAVGTVRGWRPALAGTGGLFIDDGTLAAVVLVWIAICGLLQPILEQVLPWLGAMLFLGLALILFENAMRAAKRRSKAR